MKPIKLSICICSLHQRADQLAELLERLRIQARRDEIEILIAIDGGQELVGVKRNRLVQQTKGDFVVHIDDDDLVSLRYVAGILLAIDMDPDADAIAIRGVRTENDLDPVFFDYRLGAKGQESETDKNGVIWRSPGHICPIKGPVARGIPFPETEPEDLVWCDRIRPHIHKVSHAGFASEILYFYRWDSTKPEHHSGDAR
jgi:glycosyltransferase involved in cell wall biosynthesis